MATLYTLQARSHSKAGVMLLVSQSCHSKELVSYVMVMASMVQRQGGSEGLPRLLISSRW